MSHSAVDPLDLPALLRSSIQAASDDLDTSGDIPKQLSAELREAGAFRLLRPREFGGYETPLPTALRVYEEFARIDASVAWVVWNANFGFVGAMFNENGGARIWRDGTEPTFANSGMPGTAVPVEGGFRISGQWRMVSGIRNADWLVVVAVVTESGVPRVTASGSPDIRVCAVHRDQLTVLDTWNVSGMRGSGSNDVLTEGAVVAADMVASLDEPARIDRPLYRGFIPALVFPGCSAVVLGVAQAAIDDLVRLALTKAATAGGTLAIRGHTRFTVAKSEAALQAARLLLHAAAADLQTAADRREPVTVAQRAALRAAMSHSAQVSRDVLVAMYELASSSALYCGNALERLFRDGMAALQHANHSAAFLKAAGRVRLGIDPAMPLF